MISVIIPCYNSKEYIARAIESVLSQTYKDYEIILVDNNSTDNTYNILLEYKTKYSNLVNIFKEYKKGAPAARNKGLQEAKGDWLQFLDSDDELLPGKLSSQMAIAANSKADIIVGECYMYKTANNKTEVKIRGIETSNVWKALLTSKLGSTTCNLWRKKSLLSAGGWNETKSSSQEYELMFRILRQNDNIDYCPTPETIIHVRENSIHKSGDENRFVEILNNNVNLRLQIKEYLKAKSLLTKQLAYIADTYIYSYLFKTTGVHPLSIRQGVVPAYVKKKLKESQLNLPVSFLLKFHTTGIINKIKYKISGRKKKASQTAS